MWKGPAWLIITRDIVSLVLGTFAFLWETVAVKDPNPYILSASTTMILGPAILAMRSLGGTGSESSPPPPESLVQSEQSLP